MALKIENLNPSGLLIKAKGILSKIGVDLQVRQVAREATAQRILELEVLGKQETQAVLQVLEHLDAFDDVVREQVKEMNVGERYEEIQDLFKSVLDDAERMVNQVSEDGKIGLLDKMRNRVMEWRRGSVQDRFERVRTVTESVFHDIEGQLRREMAILDAYSEFRTALQQTVIIAGELKTRGEDRKTQFAERLAEAQKAVDDAMQEGLPAPQIGALKMKRDQVQREFEIEDRRFQTAIDIAEQLNIAFATAEAVMTKLAQSTKVKDAQQRKSTTFYSTHSGVLTALTVAFTSLKGLHEGTQTQKALVNGTNDALGRLNRLGDKAQEEAIKVAYGATIDVKALRDLFTKAAQSEVRYRELIEEGRKISKKNSEEVRQVLEEGQKKMADALAQTGKFVADDVAAAITLDISVDPVSKEAVESRQQEKLKTMSAQKPAPGPGSLEA